MPHAMPMTTLQQANRIRQSQVQCAGSLNRVFDGLPPCPTWRAERPAPALSACWPWARRTPRSARRKGIPYRPRTPRVTGIRALGAAARRLRESREPRPRRVPSRPLAPPPAGSTTRQA